MTHLRLVGSEPAKRKRRVKGERYDADLFTPEERNRIRQTLRNLRDAFGTWACLADAMDLHKVTIHQVMAGRHGVSGAIVVRMMRATGLSLDEILSAPVLVDRCRACGQVKRRRA
ncbi:MAG: transcriptional regulator [Polyangiaceae bacterium]|nr:transcriptional regulator [Polyangiaceae bacterium]